MNCACCMSVGSSSSSSGYTGESMTNASPPLRTAVHVVCHTSLVATRTSGCSEIARTSAPGSGAEELRGLGQRADLGVGALRPVSRASPVRLTQITGTLSLPSGSTSWYWLDAMWTQPFLSPSMRRWNSLKCAGSGL